MIATKNLLVEIAPSGRPVYEEVLAEVLDDGSCLLKKSPGLLQGLAAGDLFVVDDDGRYTVTRRSRNVCIQVFRESRIDMCEDELLRGMESIGGWLDGKTSRLLVFTVPVSSGFAAMEEVIDSVRRRFPNVEWMYGNVYSPADGTPLNWWMGA